METIEYSVCVDCYMELAQGEGEDISHHIQRELDGREGHFSTGVAPTEDDGEEEFSWNTCELCCSRLGGSRHGVTLFIKKDSNQ